ncbi:acyltransferase [Bacteroidota bacterium]
MKTGLGLYRKYRMLYAYLNLFRFWMRNFFGGFDIANQFLQRVDKFSIQLILKKHGAKIGANCDIETGLIFHNCKNYSNLIIGNNCHIGKNCFFDLRDKLIIHNNVVISMQCSFITHIDLSKSELSKKYPSKQSPIIIKNNCYVGARSSVFMGVELGMNSIIAAGSTVPINAEQNSLIGGVPAKFIKLI